jgi:AmmeMemoRadiSam system protein A
LVPDADRQRLLHLARRALEARVRGEAIPHAETGGALELPLGAFVTIHSRGTLRGCLGRIECTEPLAQTVIELAQSVSHSDPRFPAVRASELTDISIEISVLQPERQVRNPTEIDIGRHGVIAERGRRRGLLLPQVAVEHGWDRDTLLEHVCRKAGLARHAWRDDPEVQLFIFEAEVFSENADG